MVFCVSVAHSKEVAKAFSIAGIKAAHIDGTTDDEIRDRAILDFADGKIDVLCQVNLFSEGFDLASIAQKDVTVDCLVDLAPTNSLVNAMQRWGRVLRPAPGKVAIILDHAGNTILRHGLPTTKRTWTLEGMKKQKRGENEKVIYCRCCPKCFTVHKPSPTCPNQDFLGSGKPCGHVYEVGSRQIEERDGELGPPAPAPLDCHRNGGAHGPDHKCHGQQGKRHQRAVQARQKRKQERRENQYAGNAEHEEVKVFGRAPDDHADRDFTGCHVLMRVSPR